jgi:hypothetical protein
MIASIKIVAAITGLTLYLLSNKGCCPDDQNCGNGFMRCAWAEIRGFLGLD